MSQVGKILLHGRLPWHGIQLKGRCRPFLSVLMNLIGKSFSPLFLYMYSMDFHGIPGTSPGGFCWSSPVRQLGPGRWFPYTSTGHLGVSPCKLPTGCSGDLSSESADSDWCRIGMSGHRSCPTKRSSES